MYFLFLYIKKWVSSYEGGIRYYIDARLIDISKSELVKLLNISFVDANQCADPPAKLGASQYINYASFANPPW